MERCVFNLRCNVIPSGVLRNIIDILFFQWWDQKFYDLLSVTFVSLLNWVKLIFVTFHAQDVKWCSEHGILGSYDKAQNVEAFISGSFDDEFTKRVVSIGTS